MDTFAQLFFATMLGLAVVGGIPLYIMHLRFQKSQRKLFESIARMK